VDAGAVIDGAAARACVEAVRDGTPSCARPDGTVAFAVCAPFAVEPVAIGEACQTPYCAGGEGVRGRSGLALLGVSRRRRKS
jgi:hypothetical protein